MNVQLNPAQYPPQYAYGHTNAVQRGPSPFVPPNHNPPNSFQQPGPGPQNAPNPYQQFQQQYAAFATPQGQLNNDLAQTPRTPQPSAQFHRSDSNPNIHTPGLQAHTSTPASTSSQPTNNMAAPATPMTPNNAMQRQAMQSQALAQQAQLQNATNMQRPGQQPSPALSPQSAARERARVTVLLEINTHLLQEVVSLQSQGKAGSTPAAAQPSPTSPTSAADPSNALNNSPIDASKPPNKPPSQEYADCMRRLQANLSYLAAIADSKKKMSGPLPPGPAIMIPPPHLTSVQELYKKLNALFPEAAQTTINKAMAMASAQASRGAVAVSTHS